LSGKFDNDLATAWDFGSLNVWMSFNAKSYCLPLAEQALPSVYLETTKRVLLGAIHGSESIGRLHEAMPGKRWKRRLFRSMCNVLERRNLSLMRMNPPGLNGAHDEKYVNALAFTMIGRQRLDNLHFCCEEVLKHQVPGDFIETGVWRGGAVILMRAVLLAYGVEDRLVWVADSFAGLPRPNEEKYALDRGDRHHTRDELKVPLETVESNFSAFGLLDSHVRFLKGWFSETLPGAPIERLAILRLDGDMYESTIDSLTWLYHKLSRGGFLIVDDYGLSGCRRAVDDFRAQHGIREPMKRIDWTGVYWQRTE
jgi:O-methyltransferase